MHLANLALLALAGAATADRGTMSYLYCQGVDDCATKVKDTVAHAANVSTVIMGSRMCRINEFTMANANTWCDYGSNYTKYVKQLQDAGIQVMLNTAGPHHLDYEPFYTTDLAMNRMVELADELGAIGWGFDLEESGITLDLYEGFFKKVRTAFKPKDYKIMYTCGNHFVESMNFTALLPLVDYVVDMDTYGAKAKSLHASVAKVPPQYIAKYVPGSSYAKWNDETMNAWLPVVEAVPGIEQVAFFAIQTDTAPYWWTYLGAWLQQ